MGHCTDNNPIYVHMQNGGQSLNGFWKFYATTCHLKMDQSGSKRVKMGHILKKTIFLQISTYFLPNKPKRRLRSTWLRKKFLKGLCHLKVIPIHKGGSTQDVNNFRPISLLSIFDKIIEKITQKVIFIFRGTQDLIWKPIWI